MKRRNRGNALLEVVGERFELLDFFGERADRRRAGVQAAIHRLLLLHHDRHAPRGKLLLLLEQLFVGGGERAVMLQMDELLRSDLLQRVVR